MHRYVSSIIAAVGNSSVGVRLLTSVSITPPTDVVDLFLARARHAPDHPAIVTSRDSISYGALERRVRSFAALFVQRQNPKIFIALGPSVDVYACILASGLAGGFHTPVSVSSPFSKMASILRQLEADFVIACPGLLEQLREAAPLACAIDPGQIDGSSQLAGRGHRHRLAYVFFTSGSTGAPKGVMVSRKALAHYVRWLKTWEIGPADRVAQHPNIAFDISMSDIFGALCYGGTLYPLDLEGDRLMPARFIERNRITVWNSTPSVMSLMMQARQVRRSTLGSVRLFNFCGEPLLREHLDALFSTMPGALVQNTYGPTEATIAVTALPLRCDDYLRHCERTVALGDPLPGMDVLLANGASTDEGEIVIVGPQLADGYWKDPEKTGSSFRQVSASDRRRGYFTGDWAQRTGRDIYFRERIDLQVKVRGHRIELDEVAGAIRACGYPMTCVLKHKDALAALIELPTGVPAPEPAELRRQLAERLDSYAVPQWIVAVAQIPRNENDKVDRKAAAALMERSIGATNG
jgi:D-alanine--poly(phosphoribitol) ligase subunit 1